jgi:hypothetical protein
MFILYCENSEKYEFMKGSFGKHKVNDVNKTSITDFLKERNYIFNLKVSLLIDEIVLLKIKKLL